MSDTKSENQRGNLRPAFARHKLGSAVQLLWDERRTAIHWDNVPSAKPEDYDEGRPATEISNLNKIAEKGAIVGGSYRKVHKNQMLVGIVEPNSSIDLLFIDSDSGAIIKTAPIDPGTSIDLPSGMPEDVTIYKSVQMTDCEVVSRQEQSLLFDDGVRPPFWSVCEWGAAEDQLRALARGELPPYEVGSLTTDQLEVVCEEYLRIVDDAYYRSSEIGGTTSDVDIMGASGDELVWAQVTHAGSEAVQSKIDKLGDYTEENARVIMFAPSDSRPADLDPDITFIPIEAVFESVNLNEKGSMLLSRLLGRMD